MAKPPKVKVRPPHTVSTPALQTIDFGKVEYDPRFDPRVKEQERIANTTADIEKRMNVNAPTLSLVDLEGQPFVTSMSDRTAAGANLIGLEGVPFKRPVELRGGQGYMFENPGQVWASGEKPVYDIMTAAKIMKEVTGKDPLYLPWRMSPTGSDFASMAGETMLNYAESAMGRKAKQALDKQIKQFIPDWRGVDSPESIDQFRAAPDTIRKALKNMMDVKFRDEGGINIGQARLAVSDPAQLNAPQMDIMNIGRIFADKPIIQESGHPWYPRGVPGEGVGVIDQPRNILELLPQVVEERGIPDPKNPRHEDRRSMELNVRSGIIDAKLLKALGFADGGLVNDTLEGMVQSPKAAEMLDLDLAKLALARRQGMMNGGTPRQPTHLETKNVSFEQFRNSIGMGDGGDVQPMANGGAVHMQDGGILENAFRAFVPAQVRTFVGSLAGDESPITEKNFSGDELDQMRKAIMSSRQDRTAMNARLHHEAMQNAATAKERRELFSRGPSKELDQTVGYQHYPGSPTGLMSDFSLSSDAAIRNTLGRFAYQKTPDGNLIATDLYKFRDDQSDKTRPTSEYADMGTARKLGTLAYDTLFGDAGFQTLPSRIGNAFLGNKPGRPVNVNLGKAPFAGGGAVHPSPEEMLIEMMERGYGRN